MSDSDKQQLRTAAIAALAGLLGAALTGFVTLYLGLGQNRGSDFDLVTRNLWASINTQASTIVAQQAEISALQLEVSTLREAISKQDRAQDALERENLRLEAQVDAMQDAIGTLPAAVWSKDLDGEVLYVNDLYEELFLTPRGYSKEDYVGHNDFNVWPEEVAEQFRKHDAQVILTNETFYGVELVTEDDGENHPWIIIKHPRYRQGIKSGVGGLALPMDRFPNARVILEIMAKESK